MTNPPCRLCRARPMAPESDHAALAAERAKVAGLRDDLRALAHADYPRDEYDGLLDSLLEWATEDESAVTERGVPGESQEPATEDAETGASHDD